MLARLNQGALRRSLTKCTCTKTLRVSRTLPKTSKRMRRSTCTASPCWRRQRATFSQAVYLGTPSLATHPPAAFSLMENPLPKIHIKHFGGNYKEWPAFKDIYESTVHNKNHLGKMQMFHYRKSFILFWIKSSYIGNQTRSWQPHGQSCQSEKCTFCSWPWQLR